MIPSKVWTPPSSTVRGPPLSPWEQAGAFSSQSRYSHLTLLVPRPSPPAHSMELLIVSSVRAWQSLLLFRIGTWDCGRIISIDVFVFVEGWRDFFTYNIQKPTSQTTTPTIVGMTGSIQSPCFTGLMSHTFLGGLWPPIQGGMIRTRQRCAQCQIQFTKTEINSITYHSLLEYDCFMMFHQSPS